MKSIRASIAVASAITVAMGIRAVTQRSTSPASDGNGSKLILAYDGPLERGGEDVSVRVYTIQFLAKDMEGSNILQNKIELTSPAGRLEFRWPLATFSADICELIDIDGDGRKEFVFVNGETWARVVGIDKSGFVFRLVPGGLRDEFVTMKPIEFRDLDGDGLKEFAGLVLKDFPTPGEPAEYSRVVKKWTLVKGFHEVKLER